MSVFGPIVTGADVRAAVEAHVKQWAPAYLGEVARQAGLLGDALPMFRSWVPSTGDVESWPEDQLPACVIIVPGLAGEPVQHGRTFRLRWAVGIGVVAASRTRSETTDLVARYSAAVRALMVQHQSVGGVAQGVAWLDERYDELAFDSSRTIAAGQAVFGVDIDGALDRMAGPMAPPLDPVPEPDDWPTVQTTDIDINRETP